MCQGSLLDFCEPLKLEVNCACVSTATKMDVEEPLQINPGKVTNHFHFNPVPYCCVGFSNSTAQLQ